MKSPIKAEEKMSKKILVIEDEDKFMGKIFNSLPSWAMDCVKRIIQDYESTNAIQFEAGYSWDEYGELMVPVPEEFQDKVTDMKNFTCIIFRKEE